MEILLLPVVLGVVFGPFALLCVAAFKLLDRSFRLRLSTAILLSLAAGILLGLNLYERHDVYNGSLPSRCYGFPATVYTILNSKPVYPDVDDIVQARVDGKFSVISDFPPNEVLFAWNLSVALALLAWLWLICERGAAWKISRAPSTIPACSQD